MYISGDFKILFKDDGTITSIKALLYGKNKNDFTDTFSIDYDINKSRSIKVTLNKDINIDTNYDDKYSFEPFKDYIKAIPIRYSVGSCDEKEFEIMYSGEKEWDANTKGIIYINRDGETKEPTYPLTSKTTGYTVSIFVLGKEDQYTPLKYILVDNFNKYNGKITVDINRMDFFTVDKVNSESLDNNTIRYKLNDSITYNLKCSLDGSKRTYSLYKFNKSNDEEELLNENSFDDINGWEPDITFIDEKLGFILLGTSDGDILYRTEDGGKTFNETALPGYMKYSEMCYAQWFTEYSKPIMPYKVNDKLYIKIKCSNPTKKTFELCKSNDNGLTWEVVKICSY